MKVVKVNVNSQYTKNYRNNWLVNSTCEPSHRVKSTKPTTRLHNINNNTSSNTRVTSMSISKPVTRASIKTSCLTETQTTNASANNLITQPQRGMNMILRSADRVNRYHSLRQ